jgi:hypothetical protein
MLVAATACTPTTTTGPFTSPSGLAGATASPSPSPTPTPSPTASPTPVPTPTPSPVAVVANGVWLPAADAARATRHPLAVMIDDQADARPQSGLASADIIYQAPAEGGIPRYMLIFQAGDPPSIGPVRSARRYFVGWAAEWRAMYVHAGGAPNALRALIALNGRLVWDADQGRWGDQEGYFRRIAERLPPHNVYTTDERMRALALRLGAVAPFTTPAWTFKEPAALADRPSGGTIVVPYLANRISYTYDRATNTYRRSTNGTLQRDASTMQVIAPADVVVLFMGVAPLLNDQFTTTNEAKHRLDVHYIGSGRALVFRDGTVVAARWSKKDDAAPTKLLYAGGPYKGLPVPLVRGQIVIQVVPITLPVAWKLGQRVVNHSLAD